MDVQSQGANGAHGVVAGSPEEACQAIAVQWLDDHEMDAWLGLITFHTWLMTTLDGELQERHGISLPDYEVLAFLSEAPGRRMRMSELAQRLRLSPSGLTRRLDGLVRAGMVERAACPSDRRGMNAVLTEAGYELLEKAAPDHVSGVRRHFLDRLSRRQMQDFASALQALREGCTE